MMYLLCQSNDCRHNEVANKIMSNETLFCENVDFMDKKRVFFNVDWERINNRCVNGF